MSVRRGLDLLIWRTLHLARYAVCLLCCLLAQACAVSTTTTGLVPGEELSRTSLGLRETANDLYMKEVNPYTVVVRRDVCSAELIAIRYQAVLETRTEVAELDCSSEYPNYVAHNLTSMGVPLLYDSLTGFHLLRDKCEKVSPVFRVAKTHSDQIITQEDLDQQSTKCTKLPVSGATVTARVKDETVSLITSAKGVASLPKELVAELRTTEDNVGITFRYQALSLTTVFSPQKEAERALVAPVAESGALGDEAVNQQRGAQSVERQDIRTTEGTETPLPADRQNVAAPSLKDQPGGEGNLAAAGTPADNGRSAGTSGTVPPANPAQADATRNIAAHASTNGDQSLQANMPGRNAGDANSVAADKPVTAPLTVNAAGSEVPVTPISPEMVKGDEEIAPTHRPGVSSGGQQAAHESRPRLVIRFPSNRAIVGNEYREPLRKIVQELKGDSALLAIVDGHTDNVGSAEANRKISLKRAEVVKDYMVNTFGVAKERIRVRGHGFDQPLADNGTKSGRAVNRRTEIRIIVQTQEK